MKKTLYQIRHIRTNQIFDVFAENSKTVFYLDSKNKVQKTNVAAIGVTYEKVIK